MELLEKSLQRFDKLILYKLSWHKCIRIVLLKSMWLLILELNKYFYLLVYDTDSQYLLPEQFYKCFKKRIFCLSS